MNPTAITDGDRVHQWAGQAGLVMDGIFFTPLATGDFSGIAAGFDVVVDDYPT